jgi:hypothetical protein
MRNGRLSILAAGGLDGNQSDVPHGVEKIEKFREVTTMVKYALKHPVMPGAYPDSDSDS